MEVEVNVQNLMNLIMTDQKSIDDIDWQMEKLKQKKLALTQIIEDNKALLMTALRDDPVEYDNIVAKKFSRENVGYTDESKVIELLKTQFNNQYVKSKFTESLDKVALKKALKNDTQLQEALKEYLNTGKTEYVVVTSRLNYEAMLKHMEK